MQYRYFSADSHWDPMWLPKNLWQDRLPSRLKSVGPKVIETSAGTYWEWEGKLRSGAADGRDNAKYRERLTKRGVDAPEGSLPPADPQMLLQFMDRSGIYSSVFFSHPMRYSIEDDALYRAMFRAYSDFVLEQNSAAPERIIGLPVLPSRFPDECAAEARRVARQGARAVELAIFDTPISLTDPVWEPLWEELEAENLVLCAHTAVPPGVSLPPQARGEAAAFFSTIPFMAAKPVAQLVLSGVFERHPKLRFCFGETRISWIPFFIQWLSRQAKVRDLELEVNLSMPPSEYIKRNVVFTFEEDVIGVRMCAHEWSQLAGVAVWGSDYPHGQGVWGDGADRTIDEMFFGIEPGLKRSVLLQRSLDLFDIRLPGSRDGSSGMK